MKKSEQVNRIRKTIKEVRFGSVIKEAKDEYGYDDNVDAAAQKALSMMSSKANRSIIVKTARHYKIEEKELFAYIRDLLEEEDNIDNLIDRLIG